MLDSQDFSEAVAGVSPKMTRGMRALRPGRLRPAGCPLEPDSTAAADLIAARRVSRCRRASSAPSRWTDLRVDGRRSAHPRYTPNVSPMTSWWRCTIHVKWSHDEAPASSAGRTGFALRSRDESSTRSSARIAAAVPEPSTLTMNRSTPIAELGCVRRLRRGVAS